MRHAALACLLVWASGCYAYRPVTSTLAPGTRVALDLNDQGRVGMRSLIGPEIARVEGALVHNSDTAYVVQVLETRGLYGVTSRWGGEPVSLRREYVAGVTERRLSRPRTVVAVLGGAAAFLAFAFTRDLLGRGSGGSDPGNGGGNEQ